MSWDLFFVEKTDMPAPDTTTNLIADFGQRPHFQVQRIKDGAQILYDNQKSGAYFIINALHQWDEEDVPQLPADYCWNGLQITVNYLRSDAFGREAMRIAMEIAQRYHLLVVDPQDSVIGGTGAPKQAVLNDLFASWQKSNQWAMNIESPRTRSNLWSWSIPIIGLGFAAVVVLTATGGSFSSSVLPSFISLFLACTTLVFYFRYFFSGALPGGWLAWRGGTDWTNGFGHISHFFWYVAFPLFFGLWLLPLPFVYPMTTTLLTVLGYVVGRRFHQCRKHR